MGKKASAKNAVATDLRLYDRPSKHGKSSTSAELRLAKKKKVSKKNKLAWRKHTDVADIEAFIDEKRQEERSGGLASGKGDEDLFFTHTESAEAEPAPLARRTKKREKKPLRCYAALQMEGPPAIAKVVRPKKSVKPRVKPQKMDDASEIPSVKATTGGKQKVVDPWAKKTTTIDENQDIFDKMTRRKPVKRPPRLFKKVSELPSVEVAHPGASYNPTYDDHQAILAAATEVEELKLRAVAKTEKFFEGMPEMTHFDRERLWIKEMSAGLDLDGEAGEEEGSKSEDDDDDDVRGDEAAPAPKLVRPEFKKTKQQRRKEAERRQQAAMVRDSRLATVREQEVFRIRSLKKNINQEERKLEERQQKLKEKVAEEATATRSLGPHRFRAPDIDVQLSDELAGSLRKLKPEGSTLLDRFSSLQKRNVIETRKKVVPHRRLKRKMYTKNAYKGGDD